MINSLRNEGVLFPQRIMAWFGKERLTPILIYFSEIFVSLDIQIKENNMDKKWMIVIGVVVLAVIVYFVTCGCCGVS